MFEKTKMKIDGIPAILKDIQDSLLARHKKFTEDNTHDVLTYDEFKKIMGGQRGFIRAFWCEEASCEAEIKAETKATTRCLPLDQKGLPGTSAMPGVCVHCGNPSTHRWLFAQAY